MNIARKAWKALNTPIGFKSAPIKERKSFSGNNIFDFLSLNGFSNVSAWQALRYYEQIAPVGTAVDLITDELPSLEISVFDKKDNSYSEEGQEILKFLSHPNAATSGQEFMKAYGTYFTATGEVYLIATGAVHRKPLELMVQPPQYVNIINGDDSFPDAYQVNNNGVLTTFHRKEVDKRMRYFDSSGERELWHIKDFNPNASASNHAGASRLNTIFYEIEQHLEASKHNLALLQNGGRLSMALVTEQVLDDDTFARLQEQVDRFYSGSQNAGRVFIGEGGLSAHELGKTNRDMDFRNLKRDDAAAIYNRLKIPLPLVTPENMTLANMESARIMLYDNAVIPLCRRLLSELTLFIGGRFGLSETQTLSIDPESIPALQARQIAELKEIKSLDVLTINETRARIGYEEVEGGDSVLAPAALLPIAQDRFTDDNLTTPDARNKFFDIMRSQKTADGKSRWTEKQIKDFADMEGL